MDSNASPCKRQASEIKTGESPLKRRLLEHSPIRLGGLPRTSTRSVSPRTPVDHDPGDEDFDEDGDYDAEEDEDVDDEEELGEEDDEEEEETVLPIDDYDDEDGVVVGCLSRTETPSHERDREAKKAEDLKLLALMAHFNDDQLNRFELFRRTAFTNTSVRRLIQSVAPCSFSKKVVIAMAGITKVFVGELVETALDYRDKLKESGPLQPKHIRVAYTTLQEENRTSRPSYRVPFP